MSTPPPPSGPDQKVLFHAYRETPVKRVRFPMRTVALLLLVFGVWFALQRSPQETVVITEYGMRTLRVGMTHGEVRKILGNPIAAEDADGECYRYGKPTLEKDSFLLYSLCYADGKLDSIRSARYNASVVDPATAPRPAPAE